MDWLGDRAHLAELVARWHDLRVVVLGDSFVDEWWYGEPERLSREAPVPVVALDRVERAPGGAANTAVNIAALGGRPVLVATVADDTDGAWLRQRLTEAGVDVAPIVLATGQTPVKRRMVAGGQIMLRVDGPDRTASPHRTASADHNITQANVAADIIAAAGSALGDRPAAVVVCDFGLGFFSEGLLRWLQQRRDSLPVLTIDAHELAQWRDTYPTLVKPNFTEAADLIQSDGGARQSHPALRLSTIEQQAHPILDRTGAHIAAVTLDVDGALVLRGDAPPIRTRAQPAPASHAVGAGDAYTAALTLALGSGAPVQDAATLAQLAAAGSVQGPRTCVAQIDTILADLEVSSTTSAAGGDREATLTRIRAARARGAKLVFTNGCFDVLHHGHVGFLRQARNMGDLLVVGLNSDASVARLKGSDRPVNGLEDRLAVLSALSCVDHVLVFEEDSPEWLIDELRPDVYVKGGDYRADLLPEAAQVRRLGGEVRILDYLPDRSTSSIIERIRSRTMHRDRPTGTVSVGPSGSSWRRSPP